jgi:hypothetical protein
MLIVLLRIYATARKAVTSTSVYTSFVIGQLAFSLASGALLLYVIFYTPRAWNAAKCLNIAFDAFTKNLCQRTPLFKGLTVSLLSALWIFEIGRWSDDHSRCLTYNTVRDYHCRRLIPIPASRGVHQGGLATKPRLWSW